MWSDVFLKNGLSFLENEPLARHTSIGVGGAASVFLEPANADELIFAIDLCLFHRIPFRVLGRGTNVVASDTLKTEVVISTRKLHSLQKCEKSFSNRLNFGFKTSFRQNSAKNYLKNS